MRYFFLLFLLSTSLVLSAQRGWYYGLSTGWTFSHLKGEDTLSSPFSANKLWSPYFEVEGSYYFTPAWSLHTGVAYALIGGRKAPISSNTHITKKRLAFHYLQFPISLQWGLNAFFKVRGGLFAHHLNRSYLTTIYRTKQNEKHQKVARQRIGQEQLGIQYPRWGLGWRLGLQLQWASGLQTGLSFMRQAHPKASSWQFNIGYTINYSEKPSVALAKTSRHSMHLELGGPALKGGLRYDYVLAEFPHFKWMASNTFGFTCLGKAASSAWAIGSGLLLGKVRHFLAFEIAHTTLFQSSDTHTAGAGFIGYRYHPQAGGISLRAGYQPTLLRYQFKHFRHWFACSVGWSFR